MPDLFSLYVTANAYEQSLYVQLYADSKHEMREVARIAERFANLSAERYPTITALGEKLTTGDGDERFALGIDVIVNGLLGTSTEGRMTPTVWEPPLA
jgi:hypothetical protein